MRWTIGAAACAALALAGCGGSALSEDTTAFVSGVAAFETGDRAALDAAMATLKVEARDAAPCSAEAFAAARRKVMHQILQPMNGSVMSMSEEARFVFLAGTIGRGVDYEPSPAEACKGQEGVGLLVMQDSVERGVVVQTVMKRSIAWRDALVGKYGEQLNGRLQAAASTLEANGLDTGGNMSYARITP